MDAITSYIDHMFRALPQTHEVRRAKSELLQMSEDRYHELLIEGVSEHEAVGRVITQFGNLEELADGLGIRTEFDGVGDPAVAVSASEAEGYLRTSGRAATLIGSGILIILAGMAVQVFEGGSALGIGLLLVFVAAGVATFITAGMLMGQFSRLEDRALHLDGATLARFKQQRESEQTSFMAHIVSGVVIIILGAGANAIGYVAETSAALETSMRALGPLVIGLGIFLLIRGGMRRTALDRLTSQGDYTPRNRAENTILERWAGPYWLLMVAIYLAWSFLGDAWGTSWIIWPIAGVLFALLAATVNAVAEGRQRR